MPKKDTSELKCIADGKEGCCKKMPKKGAGPDPSNPLCRKAKEIRKERKMKKVAASGADKEMSCDLEPSTSCEKNVKDKEQEINVFGPDHTSQSAKASGRLPGFSNIGLESCP